MVINYETNIEKVLKKRADNNPPKFYDVIFSTIGTAGWLYVGFAWHDRALIVLNTILLAMLSTGLFRYILQWPI